MTKTYQFSIEGNHMDIGGNAVPKLKMTGKQHWMPKARAYVEWKEYVAGCFADVADPQQMYRLMAGQKPIVLGPKDTARMDLVIYWANEQHGDPENIFGSIADALFQNDKHLAGSFDFSHTIGNGSVQVSITLSIRTPQVDGAASKRGGRKIAKTLM